MIASRSMSLIGLGPRGISTLERLTAALNAEDADATSPLTLHLIDDAGPGGRIWDPHQSDTLRMNTFAHGMTLFAEPGATVSNPVVEGPTIFEWVQLAIGNRAEVAREKQLYFDAHPASPELVERYGVSTLAAYTPHEYLPRAVYGLYLNWVFDSLLARLPQWVTPVIHRARATEITSSSTSCTSSDRGTDMIRLSDGSVIEADTTIAVTGWQAQSLNAQQQAVYRGAMEFPDLHWIAPDNPLEQRLDEIPAGEPVFVRGLGMGFFDVLAMTTIGRGGTFINDPTTRAGMRYIPSGNEPIVVASSRRGYPFLPQPDFGALPTPAAMPRLATVVPALSTRTDSESIDYTAEVYPAVVRDAYQAYADALAPAVLRAPRAEIVDSIDAAELHELPTVIDTLTDTSFDLDRWHHPLRAHAASADKLTALIAEDLTQDITEAAQGASSAVRAALWSIGSARKPTQLLGAEGRYTAESRPQFNRMIALGQMACSGPPIFRSRQLLALIDASLVTFLGRSPSLSVAADNDRARWRMTSPSSGNTEYFARTLVDAWVEKPTVLRPAKDPFVRSVFASRRARVFARPAPTASLELCPATRRVIHPDGARDPRLHFVGIPAHEQYPDTTISPPVPGTDPWFIQETDKAASSALSVITRVGVQ